MNLKGISGRLSAKRYASPAVLIVAWELVGRLGLVDPFFLPAPTRILGSMWSLVLNGELFRHMSVSLYRSLGGYFLALVLGLGFGVLICWSRRAEDILIRYSNCCGRCPRWDWCRS